MRTLLISGLVICPTMTSAQEPASLEKQAARCWNMPAQAAETNFKGSFEVLLEGNGKVTDISVVSFSPEGKIGEQFVRTASRAIEQCSPYETDQIGVIRMNFDSQTAFEKPIDPFKPLKK